jgi:alpha/beta superfamily hydrolase
MIPLRQSQRVYFPGHSGDMLAGIVDLPESEPKDYLIFAHCFTCTKDIKAVVRISRWLAQHGYGVLRFDFTGLGESKGDFSSTNFSTTRIDLRAAVDFMRDNYRTPVALMGLSLGGAACMSIASEYKDLVGVVTLAAPSDTQHLARLLLRMDPTITANGIGEVEIGGRKYVIKQQMIDDLLNFDLPALIQTIKKPMLVFHSPNDRTVHIDQAYRIEQLTRTADYSVESTKRGTSFISLPGSDHLLIENPVDIPYVASVINVWLHRILIDRQ